MRSHWAIALVAALALTIGPSPAVAGNLSSLFFPNTILEDDYAEIHFEDDGDGFLEVGETLRGIINVTKLINADNPTEFNLLGTGGNPELSGIFEIEVLTAACVTDAGGGACDVTDEAGDIYTFTFGIDADFNDDFTGASDGTMIVFFQDHTAQFALGGTSCNSTAISGDCEDNINDGTLFLTLGLSDPDDIWRGTGPLDPSIATLFFFEDDLGTFSYRLSIIDNNSGLTFGQLSCGSVCGAGIGADGLVDLRGSGDVQGTSDITTPYHVAGDTDSRLVVVPAPGSVALFGLGLVSLGFLHWRRRSRI